mmetsp:Transcript_38436/g.106053  ORF Transcript_38436/g.106053 Transcript_38436/m.106053 type:complete len:101 (-) Transcript_38436:225-527(-)|eukprot:4147744-Prymnesium_polylepis.1
MARPIRGVNGAAPFGGPTPKRVFEHVGRWNARAGRLRLEPQTRLPPRAEQSARERKAPQRVCVCVWLLEMLEMLEMPQLYVWAAGYDLRACTRRQREASR